jgi:ketosteroid isomerase-like protein
MPEESTTPDLVELTRRTFDAYNRRDFDAITRFVAPDAVYEAVSLGTTFEGVAAIRGFLEDWLGGYEEFEMEPEEILDLGNGVGFVVTRLTGRPVGSPGSSGSTLTRRRPLAFMWVDGLVVRVTAYADSIDEGRAAAERLAESRG